MSGARVRASLLLIVLCVAILEVRAQVRIREGVDINPRSVQPIQPSTPSAVAAGAQTIQVDFTFSGSLRTDRDSFMRVAHSSCGAVVDVNLKTTRTITVPASGGGYSIFARIAVTSGGPASLSVRIGSDVIRYETFTAPGNVTAQYGADVFLFNSASFWVDPEEIFSGSQTGFVFALEHPYIWCAPTVWHPNMATTLTITRGELLGRFYNALGTPIGTSVTGTSAELAAMSYLADGVQPQGESGQVTIEASSQGNVVGSTSFTVFRSVPVVDHFEVRTEEDTIAFTESTKILVKAKDADNADVDLEGDALLSFSLLGDWAYGTFIAPNGDTLKSVPVELESVRYDDAHGGGVRLAAVTKNPATSVLVSVRVSVEGDPGITGQKEAAIIEQSVEFLMNLPKTVQPVIPPQTNATPNEVNRKAFAIQWTRGGVLKGEGQFNLSTDYVDASGGHAHRNSRRPSIHENFGRFISTLDGASGRPLLGSSHSDFAVPYEYVASQFGGIVLLRVQSTAHTLLWDTVSVVEQVPGLVNFRNAIVIPPAWIFNQSDTGAVRHPDNAWCTLSTGDNLRLALLDFQDWAMSEENTEGQVTVSLNDLSLPMGGKFDIGAGWNVPNNQHYYHRTGKSVDINNVDSAFKKSKRWTSMGRRLKELMIAHGGAEIVEGPIHFEFTGGR